MSVVTAVLLFLQLTMFNYCWAIDRTDYSVRDNVTVSFHSGADRADPQGESRAFFGSACMDEVTGAYFSIGPEDLIPGANFGRVENLGKDRTQFQGAVRMIYGFQLKSGFPPVDMRQSVHDYLGGSGMMRIQILNGPLKNAYIELKLYEDDAWVKAAASGEFKRSTVGTWNFAAMRPRTHTPNSLRAAVNWCTFNLLAAPKCQKQVHDNEMSCYTAELITALTERGPINIAKKIDQMRKASGITDE